MSSRARIAFGIHCLKIDNAREIERIGMMIRQYLRENRKKGVVLGLSGGIDSSVTAALAVRAVGASRVRALLMPEADSDPLSLELGKEVADHLGVITTVEDISPALSALKCYERRNAAVASVIKGFDANWKFKMVLPGRAHTGFNFFSVVARSPDGREFRERLPLEAYLAVLAATNCKQRLRKSIEYYWADRLNFAVAGTPNLLEYDQGFFVKQGDGASDIKPIAHLYKTQIYALAEFLGLPRAVCDRIPTTDTYSLPQGQDEFFFGLPYEKFDLCLYAKNHEISISETAVATGMSESDVAWAFHEIDTKRASTRYLHLPPSILTGNDGE